MSEHKFPTWLLPYKHEWRSMSRIQKVMEFQGRPFTPWFHEVKGRLKSAQGIGTNGHPSTYYLVKHVWACARAHGITVVPSSTSLPMEDQLEEARARSDLLSSQLWQAQGELTQAGHSLRSLQRKLQANLGIEGVRDVARLAFQATEARAAPGVYFLLTADHAVVYVGQSKNVLVRMSGHAEKDFFTVRMLPEPNLEARLALEKRMIQLLRPPLNISGVLRDQLEAA